MTLTWKLVPEHSYDEKELQIVWAVFSIDDSPAFGIKVWHRENLDSPWCCDGGILKKGSIKTNYGDDSLESFFFLRFYDELVEATRAYLVKEML